MSKELRIKVTDKVQLTKMAQNLIDKFDVKDTDAELITSIRFYLGDEK